MVLATSPNELVVPPQLKHVLTRQLSHTPWCSSAATPNPHIHRLITRLETADPSIDAAYQLMATPSFQISPPHSMRAALPPTSQAATQETDPTPTTATGRAPNRLTVRRNGRPMQALLLMPLTQTQASTRMFGSIDPKEERSPLPTMEATTHRRNVRLSMLSLDRAPFDSRLARMTSGTEWCSPLTQRSV